jgi:hypothetical protein
MEISFSALTVEKKNSVPLQIPEDPCSARVVFLKHGYTPKAVMTGG